MTRPTFNCRNTLERLRENYDERQQKEEDSKNMKNARVEYTVTRTGEDGKIATVNKERVMFELDSIDPEYIHQRLEQEEQATAQQSAEKTFHGSSLVVTNIAELRPTGDDDQM